MIMNNNIDFFFFFSESLFKNEYISILIYLIIAILLSTLIISLSYLLAVQKPETEKLSTYECGFEPYEDSRHKFDVKFYLVAMVFIVFDIETMYLLPWSTSVAQLNLLGFWSMVDFFFELSVGFVYIWYIGALDWN